MKMKVRYLIIAFVLSLGIMGCSDSPNVATKVAQENTASKDEPSTDDATVTPENPSINEEQEGNESEMSSSEKMFFQQLLEAWCREYYKECFGSIRNPRNYKINSLVIEGTPKVNIETDGKSISRKYAIITGKHSWKGTWNTHNDWEYEASVTDLGEDKYEVTFKTAKWPKGTGYLTATRTIEFSY